MAVSWRGYRPRSIGFPPRTLFVIVSPWIVIPHDRFPRQGDPPPVLDRWLIISTWGLGEGEVFLERNCDRKKKEKHIIERMGEVYGTE